MDLGLEGKVAVVTGASSGIGFATCELLAREGATCVMMARRPEVLEQARERIAAIGKAEAIALDVSDTSRFGDALKDIARRHGRLDIVVNNAGAGQFAPIEQMSDEIFAECFDLSVTTPFAAMRAAFPIMERQGGGVIVNVSSVTGARAHPGGASHSSSRAALNQLSAVAAIEGAAKGIRVNTVQVGSVMTESSEKFVETYPEMAAQVVAANPFGRWGKPEEIAAAIVFLASAPASFISGANLEVDGALSVKFPY